MGWQNQQVAVEPILQRQYYPRGTDLSPIDGLSWQCFPEVMAYDTGNRFARKSPLADFSLPIACPDLDYFRFADNSVLFVGAANLIPPVSTSSLSGGHNRTNQLDR